MGTGAPTQPEQLDELLWTLIYRIDPLQLNAFKKKTRQLMNVGWLPRFCDVFCMIVRVPSSKS